MRHSFLGIFENRVLGVALLSWAIAQVLKVIIDIVRTRKFDISRLIGSGGMPSSHTSFVVALALAIGFSQGFDTAGFALSSAFALVVMYDAAGVRRAAGQQASVLNQIVTDLFMGGKPPDQAMLKELLGHTPMEVFAGMAIGILTAVWLG